MTNVRAMGVWGRLRQVASSEGSSRAVMWVLLVAIVVVVGWFGWWLVTRDDEPKVNSKAWDRGGHSSSPAPTTPGPSREAPPQLPAAVSQQTDAGVEAAVRFETDAINYAQRTGDVEPLKQVYDLEYCAVCQGILDVIAKGREHGRYLTGAEYTITKMADVVRYPADDGSIRGAAHVTIKRAAGKHFERDGRLIQDIAASPETTFSLQLDIEAGRWRIYSSSISQGR